MMLHGRKVDFTKVLKMVDDMVALLKTEQGDDDSKKAYCEKSFDDADDKKKSLQKSHKDAESAIAKAKTGMATLADEIAELEAGIFNLDKDVAEATNQRQEENAAYKELVAQDTATKELLKFAKNRLNKFYNPKLYKPAAKEELSSEGRIVDSFSLVQISKHRADPGPAPDAGSYSKSGEEATGVIAMIDLLIADMDKELTEAEAEEKNSQADYESMIADSKSKRTADTKSVEEKEKIRADMEAELESQTGVAKDTAKELYATLKYIDSLHAECDFLLQYYDTRKAARTNEITSLSDAKAVLSGADFSLLQASKRSFLSRTQ
jgi:septal ring factor EnvC (AmiA/AmiB activator)